jgi:hypothetical protein
MTEEIIKIDKPIVMNVSIYSSISQKLGFLAQGIKNEKDAESHLVYIECYSEIRTIKEKEQAVKVIRFSTNLNVWTEIYPYDKINGEILPKNVAVNLYDLYNIVDNCKDDLIAFWIDESNPENPELVIDSFYNDKEEYDELEVRLKIHEIGFPLRKLIPADIVEETKKPIFTLALSNISLYSIIHQLNTENKVDGVNIIVKNRKLCFQSNYNGFLTNLILKDYKDQIFFRDFQVFIPFNIFNLMSATGQITDIEFDIYDDCVIVETDEYSFLYKTEKEVEPFEIVDAGYKEYVVVDPENILYPVQILNRINKPALISVAEIEKVDDKTGDVVIKYDGRYSASVRIKMAMLSDDKVLIDSDLLESIFTGTNVDAIKIKYFENKNLIIRFENLLMEKEMFYDHGTFMKYRESLIKKG